MVADDGFRLYLDGKIVIDSWIKTNKDPKIIEIALEKGKQYDLKIEFYETRGEAVVHLIWETPRNKANRENGTKFELDASVIKQVKDADVAIFVGGLDSQWEGEEMNNIVGIDGFQKGDRTKIELPAIQIETLKALLKTGTPVVFVLMSGSAIAFDGLENELPAILTTWYPGQSGGNAVADVLFGKYNPAGRLPVTFYKSTKDLGDFRDYNMQNGNGLTYRYFKGDVLYPFGHGLSYTSFKYSEMTINKPKIYDKDSISISVKVKNIGAFDGDEVVQVYVKDLESKIVMPAKQLRAFKRVSFKKGEEKTINFTLKAEEDMRYYDPFYKKYKVEPGDFEIQIGASSQDIRLKQIITVQ